MKHETNQALEHLVENSILGMSQTKLNKQNVFTNESNLTVVNNLSICQDAVDESLFEKQSSDASIFVVVPSHIDITETLSSALCIQISEGSSDWNRSTYMTPKNFRTSVTCDVRVPSHGNIQHNEASPKFIGCQKDNHKNHPLKKYNANLATKNKRCQVYTSNEMITLRNCIVGTDTTEDRPCCCTIKSVRDAENILQRDYNESVANVLSEMLITQGDVEDLQTVESENSLPTPSEYIPANVQSSEVNLCSTHSCWGNTGCHQPTGTSDQSGRSNQPYPEIKSKCQCAALRSTSPRKSLAKVKSDKCQHQNSKEIGVHPFNNFAQENTAKPDTSCEQHVTNKARKLNVNDKKTKMESDTCGHNFGRQNRDKQFYDTNRKIKKQPDKCIHNCPNKPKYHQIIDSDCEIKPYENKVKCSNTVKENQVIQEKKAEHFKHKYENPNSPKDQKFNAELNRNKNEHSCRTKDPQNNDDFQANQFYDNSHRMGTQHGKCEHKSHDDSKYHRFIDINQGNKNEPHKCKTERPNAAKETHNDSQQSKNESHKCKHVCPNNQKTHKDNMQKCKALPNAEPKKNAQTNSNLCDDPKCPVHAKIRKMKSELTQTNSAVKLTVNKNTSFQSLRWFCRKKTRNYDTQPKCCEPRSARPVPTVDASCGYPATPPTPPPTLANDISCLPTGLKLKINGKQV